MTFVAGEDILVTDHIIQVTAGEALTARDAVYILASDGKAYKCDADDLTKIGFVGFVVADASAAATVNIQVQGHMGGFSGLTAGAVYLLSGTAGSYTATPPTNKRIVGHAVSTTVMKIFSGFARINRIAYTSTGGNTWTKYPGLAYIRVQVQAGGGGGAGGTSGSSTAGGGGSGAYTEGDIWAASLGATETATVGIAGTAGAANGNGGTGGTSSFGTHLVCTGGGGGTTGGSGGSGGSVSTAGDFSFAGLSGSVAEGIGTDTRHFPAGASAYMSKGGRSNTGNYTDAVESGQMDSGYGGGGPTAVGDSVGSTWGGTAGLQGIIIVTEYYVF